MVKFRAFNLLADFASLGSFDVILCRNVLIYFDQDTKTDVLCRLAEAISSDGYLMLGAAESALGLSDRFRMVSDKPGLYTLNAARSPVLAQQSMMPTRPRLIAINGSR